MNRAETKNWAKQKIKGHVWELLIPILVAGFLTNLSIVKKVAYENGILKVESISLGIFFAFVGVGLTSFMVKYVNGGKGEFKDLFSYLNDYVRIFLTTLLEAIFVVLWALLLIIPGIVKLFGYALVTFLLADEKYKDLGYRETLKKSEEMMEGHKMDLFIFELSYIGWFFLVVLTLGLLGIWVIPYYTTAKYKFLDNIKKSNEMPSPAPVEPTVTAEAQVAA